MRAAHGGSEGGAAADPRYPVSGAILVGGQSRRMGQDKAGLLLGGRRLLEWPVEALRPLVAEILIVGGEHWAVAGASSCSDRFPGAGPLAGIHAALDASRWPFTLCLACDLPLVRPSLLGYLCRLAPGHDAVVPCWDEGLEPMHAVYGRACLPVAETLLRAGRCRADALFAAVNTRRVEAAELRRFDPELESFVNVNTPAELAEAERRLAARRGRSPSPPCAR